MSPSTSSPGVLAILAQHVSDAASLRAQRSARVAAPHVELRRLARSDERLHAHLDGLTVAGDAGYRLAQEALETPGVGQLFTLAVLAIERRDHAQIDRLLALVDAVPDAARALVSAFGWVSPASLRGFTTTMLASKEALLRWLALAACAAHRVDAGTVLDRALESTNVRERAVALKSAGVLGRPERASACVAHLDDANARCGWYAAASALMLGNTTQAAEAIRRVALAPPPAKDAASPSSPGLTIRDAALRLHLLSSSPDAARQTVRQLAADATQRRRAVQAAGWAGDLQAVPWLMQQMDDPRHARVAGEAFTLLTGADLAALDLEGPTPEAAGAADSGPTEDAEDDRVALDEDESLPWPDIARVHAWWQANASRLGTGGRRCFMGAPVSPEHLMQVLRTGAQRQRATAAVLQVLAEPGRQVLFNVAAPAPRQQRLLGLSTRVV
jgi:uncharacterized protein (TIGR02270 family)